MSESSERAVVVLTKDLFFVPTIQQAAAAVGMQVFKISSTSASELAKLSESGTSISAAIIDLSAISLADLDEIHATLRSFSPQAVLSAFGSHVHEIRLVKAREAGFDPVLTKGQFSNSVTRLLADWSRVEES